MYLKSIEISGFKSFAKKVELDFTSRVSAIVGPNGSGKSNIAESFRFVLGEQSIKSMRGKSGADLLFRGGPGASKISRAAVSITFSNLQKLCVKVVFPAPKFPCNKNTFAVGKSASISFATRGISCNEICLKVFIVHR